MAHSLARADVVGGVSHVARVGLLDRPGPARCSRRSRTGPVRAVQVGRPVHRWRSGRAGIGAHADLAAAVAAVPPDRCHARSGAVAAHRVRRRKADAATGAAPAAAPAAGAPPAAPQGGGGGLVVQGLPLLKPPYGILNAIDLDKGEIKWQVPHGDTPDAVRNSPLLAGKNIPKTGQAGTASCSRCRRAARSARPGPRHQVLPSDDHAHRSPRAPGSRQWPAHRRASACRPRRPATTVSSWFSRLPSPVCRLCGIRDLSALTGQDASHRPLVAG